MTMVNDKQLTFEEQPGVVVEGAGKDSWDDTGQIFFTGNYAWGIAPDLRTLCLGTEFEVQAYLKGGTLPKGIGQVAIETLQELRELKGKESENNGKQPNIQRPSSFRGRTTGKAKRGATHIKSAAFRKRLPGGKTKR